jgi:hypothetical protein
MKPNKARHQLQNEELLFEIELRPRILHMFREQAFHEILGIVQKV